MIRIASAAVALTALSACASTPREIRPIAGFVQEGSAEQARAQCKFEATKAQAGEQSLGAKIAIGNSGLESCMEAKGYLIIRDSPPAFG